MAAPSYIGNGGIGASDNSNSVAVPYPAVQANDIIIIQLLSAENDTHNTPTGFAALGTAINESTNQTSSWWWKRAAGTESGTLTCTRADSTPGDAFFGIMSCWRGARLTGTPFNYAGPTSGNSNAYSSSAITPTYDYSTVICLCNEENNVALGLLTDYSTEAFDVNDTTGDDVEFNACYIYQTTKAAVAAKTGTITNAQSWATITLALWSPIPLTINATCATATGTGYDPTIQAVEATVVSATKGAATGASYAATVQADVDVTVTATKGAATGTDYAATVQVDTNISVGTGGIGDLVDSKSQPEGGGAPYTCAANSGAVVFTYTAEITANKRVRIDWRKYWDGERDLYWLLETGRSDGHLYMSYEDATSHYVDDATGVLSDGVQYTITIIYSGTVVSVLVDDTPVLSGDVDFNTDKTEGRIYHDLVTNDIELSSYEYSDSLPAEIVATANDATLKLDTAIQCAKGAATVTSYNPTVFVPTGIDCACGLATVTGYDPTINIGTGISTDVSVITVTGYDATLNIGTVISATAGAATATGYSAGINGETDVAADVAVATVVGYNPIIQLEQATLVSATKGAILATGNAATVQVETAVNCTLGTLSSTGYAAAISANEPISINATKGTAAVTGYDAGVGGFTYYMRADGTAANKAAAIGPPSSASACMNQSVHHGSTFSPGDTILLSDQGGRYYTRIYTVSSGADGAPITYANVPGESPIITGARLITGWEVYSGDVYRVARTQYTPSLFYDDAVGAPQASIVACVAEGDWYHDGSAYLYLCSPSGDPDTVYTDPGIEVSYDDRAFVPQNDYIVVDGLNCSKATYAGIGTIAPGDHLIIRNCVLEYNHDSSGIALGTSAGAAYTDILIEDNIARYNGECGISPNYNGTNIIVRRNECYGNGKLVGFQGVYPAGIKCFDDGNDLEGVDIYHNVCYDNGRNYEGDNPGRGCGIWFDNLHPPTPTRNKIHHNLIYDNAGCGIFIEITDDSDVYCNVGWDNAIIDTYGGTNAAASIRVDTRASFTCDRNRIYNNTFKGGYQGLAVTAYDVEACSLSDNLFKNNIFVGATTYAAYMRYGGDNDGTYGSGNVYSANCFGAEANNFIGWGGTDYDTYDAWAAATDRTENPDNHVEADPAFKDTVNDKYYLTSASPCINAGVNLGATYDDGLDPHILASAWPDAVVTLDQDSWGTGWEIGAYVYDYVDVAAATATTYAATILTGSQTINATVGAVTVTGYDIGLAADLVISSTSDAVTVTGLDVGVSAGTGISATAATATASALAATISADETIAASSGAITAVGNAATVIVFEDVTVSATKGTATATSHAASVQADVDVTVLATAATATATDYAAVIGVGTGITATGGTVTAAGYDVALAADNNVTATKGAATATGNAAVIAVGSFIAADVATATATGYNPTVLAAMAIPATAGIATATGYDATVGAELVIPITLGAVTVAGYASGVGAKTAIAATVANVVATALNASISGITAIGATKASATLTGYDPVVSADVVITATLGTAALTALNALLSTDVTTVATKGTITVTGCNPAILLPIDITAAKAEATAAVYAATVNVGTNISIDVAAATATAHNPVVYWPLGIEQISTPAITAIGLDATIFEGIINITCGTITVTARTPTVTIPFRFLISPTITSSSISYTTTSSSIDYSIEEIA